MFLVLFIYLVDVIGSIDIIVSVILSVLVFLFIVSAVSIGSSKLENEKTDPGIMKLFKTLTVAVAILLSVKILLPSEKTMYLMAGAYVGQQIITNEAVSNKLEKVNKIIDYKLDDIIAEYEKDLKGAKE